VSKEVKVLYCPFTGKLCSPKCAWYVDGKCAIAKLVERLDEVIILLRGMSRG